MASGTRPGHGEGSAADAGRLVARPGPPSEPGASGVRSIGPAAAPEALLYVPAGRSPTDPLPLVLMLHGASGDVRRTLTRLSGLADAVGLILLAPRARGQTWDLLRDGYGPDVENVDRALAQVFAAHAVDPARVAIEGFSDGASYALSLGLTNGDLFTHVIAFSPGFMAPARLVGRPRLFVAHGVHDAVLPIGPCSRRIVPALRQAGYDVDYHEFDGPHTVPPEIARGAVAWFTRSR